MISFGYCSFEALGDNNFVATENENVFLNSNNQKLLIVGQNECILIDISQYVSQPN